MQNSKEKYWLKPHPISYKCLSFLNEHHRNFMNSLGIKSVPELAKKSSKELSEYIQGVMNLDRFLDIFWNTFAYDVFIYQSEILKTENSRNEMFDLLADYSKKTKSIEFIEHLIDILWELYHFNPNDMDLFDLENDALIPASENLDTFLTDFEETLENLPDKMIRAQIVKEFTNFVKLFRKTFSTGSILKKIGLLDEIVINLTGQLDIIEKKLKPLTPTKKVDLVLQLWILFAQNSIKNPELKTESWLTP